MNSVPYISKQHIHIYIYEQFRVILYTHTLIGWRNIFTDEQFRFYNDTNLKKTLHLQKFLKQSITDFWKKNSTHESFLTNILNKMNWKFPLCYVHEITSNCIHKILEVYIKGIFCSRFSILVLQFTWCSYNKISLHMYCIF